MELRIEHDDDPTTIMEKVNAILKPYGIAFIDDGKDHEGYVIYEPKKFRRPGESPI